jgi:hypothetical protein
MLIEIPVFICFNAESAHDAYRSASSHVFGAKITLRFDPEDSDVKPTYSRFYPSIPTAEFYPWEEMTILEFLPRHADAQLAKLADADPESYFVDKAAAAAQREKEENE